MEAILKKIDELREVFREETRLLLEESRVAFRHLEEIEWEESNVQDCTQGDDSVQPLVISSRGNVLHCSNQLTHENIEEKLEVSHEMVRTQTDRKVFDEMPNPIEDYCATFGDKLGISMEENDIEIQDVPCLIEFEMQLDSVMNGKLKIVDEVAISLESIVHHENDEPGIDERENAIDKSEFCEIPHLLVNSCATICDTFGIYEDEPENEIHVAPCLDEIKVKFDSVMHGKLKMFDEVVVSLENVWIHVDFTTGDVEPKILDEVIIRFLQLKMCGCKTLTHFWILYVCIHGFKADGIGTHGVFHFKVFDRGKWMQDGNSLIPFSPCSFFQLCALTW